MFHVFNVIPIGFFNNLASGSNQRIYSDCIQLIYKEYEREISYRIPRNRIRDTLAIYFLENHVELSNDEYSGDRTANDMAGAVIRKFLSKEVGWLDEEIDDATYEKQIVMTENGIALAEFLNQLEKPEQEEFSSYIYNIYNTLNNAEQWKENPYVNGIKNINKNARDLSKALKKLSTFIRKIIEKMVQEKTLESLTENILEYCEGKVVLCLDTGNTIQIDSSPMALSSDLIKQIVSIRVERENIVTVENLTSFHRVNDENCAYIYLAGYHNSEKQALLRRINKENPRKNWYHFGDIDPDGFYILEHLRKGTGIDFEPLYMDVLELKKYAKYCKELSGKDRVKAENLITKGKYVETLRYMLSNNCKLEQEIISISC